MARKSSHRHLLPQTRTNKRASRRVSTTNTLNPLQAKSISNQPSVGPSHRHLSTHTQMRTCAGQKSVDYKPFRPSPRGKQASKTHRQSASSRHRYLSPHTAILHPTQQCTRVKDDEDPRPLLQVMHLPPLSSRLQAT